MEIKEESRGCPSCGNGNIQRAEMIWDLGTGVQETTGTAYGATFSQGGFNPSVYQVQSTSQISSTLAKKYAKPYTSHVKDVMPYVAISGVSLVVSVLILLVANRGHGFLFFWALLSGGFLGWNTLVSLPMARDKDAMAEQELPHWRKIWVCLSCGHNWTKD